MTTAARLAEDKALRDAALAVFQDDLRFIRHDLEGNKGQLAAAVAAIVLWFARAPILHGLADLLGIEDEDAEQSGGDSRSDDD